MTISRFERILLAAIVAAGLAGCEKAPAPAPKEGVAGILQEGESRVLSDRLGRHLAARHDNPELLDRELVEAGFKRVPRRDACKGYAYEGKPERDLLKDTTLRVTITSCPAANTERQTISVTRGDS
jgi:hypothetical protein